MARVRLSDPAGADLLEIYAFTLGKWGEAQAHAYLAEIDRAIERAAEVPGMNPLRRIGRESYRVARAEQHFVFYVEEPGGIGVARVLHGSRDIEGIFRTQELWG